MLEPGNIVNLIVRQCTMVSVLNRTIHQREHVMIDGTMLFIGRFKDNSMFLTSNGVTFGSDLWIDVELCKKIYEVVE